MLGTGVYCLLKLLFMKNVKINVLKKPWDHKFKLYLIVITVIVITEFHYKQFLMLSKLFYHFF